MITMVKGADRMVLGFIVSMVAAIEAKGESWKDFIEDGEISIDKDAVFEEVFEKLVPDDLPEEIRETLADELYDSPQVQAAFREMSIAVREGAEDAAEYSRGPMHYYGLRQSDFI